LSGYGILKGKAPVNAGAFYLITRER